MYIPYKKLIKYWIGGGIGAVVDLALLYVFTEYFGIYYLISQVLAFIISVIVGFLFQKHITFQQKWGNVKIQWGLFISFQIVWIAMNIGIMALLVELGGVHYLIASIIAKWVIFLRNFYMNHRYNFKS